jgi:hypothetical protein
MFILNKFIADCLLPMGLVRTFRRLVQASHSFCVTQLLQEQTLAENPTLTAHKALENFLNHLQLETKLVPMVS